MEPDASKGNACSGDHAPAGAFVVPETIARYRILQLLGEGTMGRVFLAHDPDLARNVAVKILRLDAANGSAGRDSYIARFRNEARAAARFMHPNMVAVHDAGLHPV